MLLVCWSAGSQSARSSAGLLRGRTVDHVRNRLECAEEHLNAPVAVGEQTGGISEIVSLCSNLDRHSLSLPTAWNSAMTKVSGTKWSKVNAIPVGRRTVFVVYRNGVRLGADGSGVFGTAPRVNKVYAATRFRSNQMNHLRPPRRHPFLTTTGFL